MPKDLKNPHAAALGRLGGLARGQKLTRAQLHEIAVKAGKAAGLVHTAKASRRTKPPKTALSGTRCSCGGYCYRNADGTIARQKPHAQDCPVKIPL